MHYKQISENCDLYLGDSLDILKTLPDNSIDSIVTDPPYGISFMNKKWDYDMPNIELWKEVLRVLKPGGHALVACGTRTQHRMAVNLEDAGFEIRDIIAYIYGSGFPKSTNIAKNIDKIKGNKREIIGIGRSGTGNTHTRTMNSVNKKGKEVSGGEFEITKGNSEYEGLGSAIKPAMELWTLCRKPLTEKNIAENVLKYGTGGLNIDDCRVEIKNEHTVQDMPEYKPNYKNTVFGNGMGGGNMPLNSLGRYPANVIHDGSEEVLELFPNSKSGKFKGKGSKSGGIWNKSTGRPAGMEYGDNGSAARFFYCAKASKTERNLGITNIEEKNVSHDGRNRYTEGPHQRHDNVQKNHHPTVKPIALMEYLCKLITPKDGLILDPFMGSGTTGIAAVKNNYRFIGIEREKEYVDISKERITYFIKTKPNTLF